jgi:hypothetical protein
MRSTRVGGRTHSWVVETFFERAREREFEFEKGGHFCRARACIPRQQTSTQIKAKVQHLLQVVLYGLSRSYNIKVGTEIEERYNIKGGRTVRIFEVPYSQKRGTEIEGKYNKSLTGRTVRILQSVLLFLLAQKSRKFVWYFLSGFGTFPKAGYNI